MKVLREVWVLAAFSSRRPVGIGHIRLLLCSWLLMVLCACSAGAANNPASTPAESKPGTLDGRYLVNGAPGVFYDFHAATGTVQFSKEAPGSFRVQGNTVTVTHANGVTSQLQRLDEDHWAAGSRFVLTRESVAQSAQPAAAAADPWDAAQAQTAATHDQGPKQPYECAAETVVTVEQHMTRGSTPVAADLPEAGIHKKSDTVTIVDATSATAAAAILKAAWAGGGMAFRARCERPVASAAVPPAAVPWDQYETITDGLQLLSQYYAQHPGPVDYEGAIQGLHDSRYAQEQDAFKKRDLLAAFSAKLDAAIAYARAHPYIQMPEVMANLPAFDLSRGTYDLSKLISPDQRFRLAVSSPIEVRLADPAGFTVYRPASETEARTIEAGIAKSVGRGGRLVLFGKVVQADAGDGSRAAPYVVIALTRVAFRMDPLLSHSTAPLFTIDAR